MLQVGFGSGDITPDVGMDMPGGFFRVQGKGVRDHRLLAVACVVTGALCVVGSGWVRYWVGRAEGDRRRRERPAAG